MMTVIALAVFGTAFAMTTWVMAATLLPAMPRIVALLIDGRADASPATIDPVRNRPAPIMPRRAALSGAVMRVAA